jgi:hypothetical protein
MRTWKLRAALHRASLRLFFGYARGVNIADLITGLDAEIARLQQARQLLADGEGVARPKRGGPAKKGTPSPTSKHKLSPESRARIVEAQKRRWAAQKKAAHKKVAKKNAAGAANAAE